MKKIKRLYILLIIAVLPLSGFGQYIPQFSQLIKTLEFINPGYNASKDHTSLVMLYRNQWEGFEGSPVAYALNAHIPINKWHMGVNANMYSESLGLRTQSNFDLGCDVDVRISSLSYLTFGLAGGMESKLYDFDEADWADAGVPISSDYTQNLFHAGAGINLFAQNLHLGASMYYTQYNGEYYNNDERFSYYFNGSYLIPIGKSLALKPSCLVRMFYGQTDIDYGMFILFKDFLWLGVANRYDQAMIFMADIKITKLFRLGYSFDYGMSSHADFKYDSHELRLEFNIPNKKKTFERLIPN